MNKVLESLLARQAFKESRFNPKAVSPVGARGLAQFMPETWRQFQQAFGDYTLDAFNSEHSIKAQKWYMNWLDQYIAQKDSTLSEEERAPWVLAAYNWGPGNVNKLFNTLRNEGKDTANVSNWITKIPKETEDYIKTIYFKQDPQFEEKFSLAMNNDVMQKFYNQNSFQFNPEFFTKELFSEATKEKWARIEEAKKKVLESNLASSPKFEPFVPGQLSINKDDKTETTIEDMFNLNKKKEDEKSKEKEIPEVYISVFDKLKSLPTLQTNLSSKFVIPIFNKKFGGKLYKW